MSNDTPLVQLLIGRWGSAITGIASIITAIMGIEIAPHDVDVIVDSGTQVLNASNALYAAGLGLVSVIQALISRYKKR